MNDLNTGGRESLLGIAFRNGWQHPSTFTTPSHSTLVHLLHQVTIRLNAGLVLTASVLPTYFQRISSVLRCRSTTQEYVYVKRLKK